MGVQNISAIQKYLVVAIQSQNFELRHLLV